MAMEKVIGAASADGAPATDGIYNALRARLPITRNIQGDYDRGATFGERLADRVAEIGGSWRFVLAFAAILVVWTLLNLLVLPSTARFDPYPFIFLNLLLSMLAAVQAPIIMMSQNRQAAKDRLTTEHDFEINLKAELEILSLHEKLDALHREHSAELSALRALLEDARNDARRASGE